MKINKKISSGAAVAVLAVAVLIIPQVANAATSVHSTSLAAWDTSDVRATGHYEFTADSLHIWTEGNTSTDKVAAYYPLAINLSTIGEPSLNYTSNFGISPGLQIVVDLDGNGTTDTILVGESVYGNDWWGVESAWATYPSGAPETGGGFGSTKHGTLAQWNALYPSAKVQSVGFSLGSGVFADGQINSMTFGETTFTFGLPVVESPDPTPSPEPSLECPDGQVPGAPNEEGEFICQNDDPVVEEHDELPAPAPKPAEGQPTFTG